MTNETKKVTIISGDMDSFIAAFNELINDMTTNGTDFWNVQSECYHRWLDVNNRRYAQCITMSGIPFPLFFLLVFMYNHSLRNYDDTIGCEDIDNMLRGADMSERVFWKEMLTTKSILYRYNLVEGVKGADSSQPDRFRLTDSGKKIFTDLYEISKTKVCPLTDVQ